MTKNMRKTILAAAVAAAVIAPIVYVLVASPPLPARTPPAGLRAGRARIEVAEFTPAARPEWHWREHLIRSGVSATPSAAFKISAHTLFWHAWFRVPVRGTYDIAAKSDGRVLVFVDHHDAMIVRWRSNCRSGSAAAVTTTAAGAVVLAAGWHEISGDLVACGSAAQSATVALSIRAPGAAAAEPLVPYWPADATKTAAAK